MSAPGDAWASSLSDSLRASLREAVQNGHRTLASVTVESTSRGGSRFGDVARECLRVAEEAVVEEPGNLPAGAGPVWTGGFAFDPEGAGSSSWSSFNPATMRLPEVSICRTGDEVFLTVNVLVGPGDDLEQAADRAESRVSGLRAEPLALIDPHRLERPT